MTRDSYNQDVIVEKNAPPPVVPGTTASMEQGAANTGFSWFERGYVAEWPSAGLPPAGSTFASIQSPDHQYQMPASYEKANAVLIDAARSTATIAFKAPMNYSALSFLTSSGVQANTLRYTVRYGDRGSESGTFVSPNWYGAPDPAWVTSGRVDVTTFAHADMTSYDPRLYSVDITLTNLLGPITAVELTWVSGSGHTAVFAVSGALAPGADFLPTEISGYNEDVIIEAGAVQPGFLNTNTTATLDQGTANTRFTWYEQGYYPPAPDTGLPAPGSTIASESDPNHHFAMPASYNDRNAILLDAVCSNAVLTFATPAFCSGLSFLTASSQGPVTNQCLVHHADGTLETNMLVSPDWLGSDPAALTAHGRVSVSTKLTDRINSAGPRLYAVDLTVVYTNSPVSRITLSLLRAGAQAHAMVLAVSAATYGTSPARPSLSITVDAQARLTIHSTQPGRLQSCLSPASPTASWKEEGPIAQTVRIAPAGGEPARFYRVVTP